MADIAMDFIHYTFHTRTFADHPFYNSNDVFIHSIKSDNHTLATLTSALMRISSTFERPRVQGANRQCRTIALGPRSRQRGVQLNDTAYRETQKLRAQCPRDDLLTDRARRQN